MWFVYGNYIVIYLPHGSSQMFMIRICISIRKLKNKAVILLASSTTSLNMANNDLLAFDLPKLTTMLRVIYVYTLYQRPYHF